MMATGEDIYRKPCTGMWTHFKDNMNDGLEITLADSFYAGDAAGRPKSATRKKKDHGIGDRGFAINVGIDFFTPEMLFLGQPGDLPPAPPTPFDKFGGRTSIWVGEEYTLDSSNLDGKPKSLFYRP
jgi:hypothetical protein